MSDETTTVGPDPSTILCRVVDVNSAIQNAFTKFLESESKTLEDLATSLRDEMSQIELFVPNMSTAEQTDQTG